MFEHRFLTTRLTPGEGMLEINPHEDCDYTGCGADDDTGGGGCQFGSDNCGDCSGLTCGYCSGGCTNCTATCRGARSAGALIPEENGRIEVVLDLEGLRSLLNSLEGGKQGS